MNDPHQSLQRPTSGLTALPSGHGPPAPRPSRRAALFPIKGCGTVAFAQWPWSTELRAEPGRRLSMTPLGGCKRWTASEAG
jgi:hypothetical protein